jgi:hypothetical protein
MRTDFLVTGLVLLLVASFLMMYMGRSEAFRTGGQAYGVNLTNGFENPCKSDEMYSEELGKCVPAGAPGQAPSGSDGFTDYFLENAGGYGAKYETMGPFDGVKLVPKNGVSQYRNTAPNEPMMGPAFEPGPDSLFLFKNNQCKPECCGASYACDGGCVCSTPEQRKMVNTRGGNRSMDDGF